MNDSTITCDEIIDAKAKSNDEETNQFQEILIKKYNMQNTKFLYFTYLFINYHCIIESCQYLLLSDKISKNTTQITNLKKLCINNIKKSDS